MQKISLRKAMFVLPNLFTVSSIFLGVYALTLCDGDASPLKLYQAALAIIFAMVFDGFDGRVARMTRTQSEFGMQLDSLADVISFGAAPALLVYKWALAPLGLLGIFIAGFYAACGAMRLARFNVLSARGDKGSSHFFVGLPIPLAAGTITALVIAHYKEFGAATDGATRAPVAVITLLLSLLMVSTVRYRTFKDVHLSRRSAAAFVGRGRVRFFGRAIEQLAVRHRPGERAHLGDARHRAGAGTARRGVEGARGRGSAHPGDRAGEAPRGGLLPRPPRPAPRPPRLGGALRAPAPAGRGPPVRDHVPPRAAGQARARVTARRHRGRRPDAQEGLAEAVRLARTALARDRGGDREDAGHRSGARRRDP